MTGAVIAAVLVTLTTLGELRSQPRSQRRRTTRRRLYYAAATVVALLLLSSTVGLWLLRSDFEAGQSADDFFTISPLATCPGAATYILEHDLPGPIFNDMSLGGYLTYRLYPRHQLFIDNRILSNRQMREYMEMSLSRDRWLAAEKKHGFRTAVLTNLTVPSFVPLRSFLAADRRWRLVFADPMASVFVRTEASSATQVFNEPRKVPFLVPEDGFGSWSRKVAGLFFRTSPSPLLDQYLSALGNLQRYELVDKLATEALRQRPEDPAIYRARGSARMVRRRLQEGLSDIREAVRYGPDDPANHFTYALALRDSGDPRQALSEVEKAQQLDPGNDRFETLRRQLAVRVR